MVYEVPASKRSLKQNVFEFKVPGSAKVYSIPKAEFLTMGQVETLQQKEDEVSLTDVLDLIGAAGRLQPAADRFANGFNDPADFEDYFYDPEKTGAYLASLS